MAKTIKTSYTKKRVEDFKDFYDSMTRSLINQRKLSKAEAADLTRTNINAALERHADNVANVAIRESYAISLSRDVAQEDPLGLVRRRAFYEVLKDEFDTRMESSLSSEQAARAKNVSLLEGFAVFRVTPESSSAFLANAALDAQAWRSNPEVYLEAQGALQRTVGIFPKENRQASLVIHGFDASEGSPTKDIVSIDKFLLTQVSEPSSEKYQIYQTFDQDFIFFFDRNPHIYVYSGVLINADGEFQWRNEFQEEYEKNLRGTKCVENGARAILSFEDVTREGYLLDLNIQNVSNNPMHTPFSFTFFVTKEFNTRNKRSSVPKYDELVRSGAANPFDELVTPGTGGQ